MCHAGVLAACTIKFMHGRRNEKSGDLGDNRWSREIHALRCYHLGLLRSPAGQLGRNFAKEASVPTCPNSLLSKPFQFHAESETSSCGW